MNITFSKDAVKVLSRLDAPTKQRIKQAIFNIPQGDNKRLQGKPIRYRLRVGDWRILYTSVKANIILIEAISPRGDAYK